MLHCRPADEHDFAALAELRWAHEAEEGGLRGADKDGFMTAFLAFLARSLKNGSYMFWVAEENGTLSPLSPSASCPRSRDPWR